MQYLDARLPGSGFLSKEAEQKIKFLENLLKESETRVRDAEDHAAEKEKAFADVLKRLDEYESGDYQLEQAVGEIKSYKNQCCESGMSCSGSGYDF